MGTKWEEEDWHQCHFCGEYVNSDGYEHSGKRHYLSDCRPDLVEHEIGDLCTWAFRREPIENKRTGGVIEPLPQEETCYAYQDGDRKWTKEHIHFYPDGPM